MLGRQAPPRNLAIHLISSHGTASASTFLLDEWPILNFVFEVDFLLSSKREAFFVSALKAQPSPKLANNVLGYVLTEQFPNGSGPDQICSRTGTVSFMSICSHGTGTEMVRYQSTSGPTSENQLFVPISPPADQNAWKTIEEDWIYGLKEAKGLWPDNKSPHPCRLQNTQPKYTSF